MSSGPGRPPPRAPYDWRCPRCHAPVAADAGFCPNCGYDLRPRRGASPGWIALAAVIALLVGGGIAYAIAGGANGGHTTTVEKTVKGGHTSSPSTSTTTTTTSTTSTVTGPTSTVTSTSTSTTTVTTSTT